MQSYSSTPPLGENPTPQRLFTEFFCTGDHIRKAHMQNVAFVRDHLDAMVSGALDPSPAWLHELAMCLKMAGNAMVTAKVADGAERECAEDLIDGCEQMLKAATGGERA